MSVLEHTIDLAWERRASLTRTRIEKHLRPAIEEALGLLESGKRRVAEPDGKGGWKVNLWLKKAVLLYFRISESRVMGTDPQPYWTRCRCASRVSTRCASARLVRVWCRAPSCAAARTSARMSC